MSEQLEDVVENLKQTSAWQRVFFTLGFALLFNVVLVPLALLIVLVQVAFTLFTGERNARVLELSEQFVAYIVQIVEFLLFLSEQKPFPFSDFPDGAHSRTADADTDEQDAAGNEAASHEDGAVSAAENTTAEADNESVEVGDEQDDQLEPETNR